MPAQRPAPRRGAWEGSGGTLQRSAELTRALERAEICLTICVLSRKDLCSNEEEPSVSQNQDCVSTKTESGVWGRALEQMEGLILFLSSPCIFRA